MIMYHLMKLLGLFIILLENPFIFIIYFRLCHKNQTVIIIVNSFLSIYVDFNVIG